MLQNNHNELSLIIFLLCLIFCFTLSLGTEVRPTVICTRFGVTVKLGGSQTNYCVPRISDPRHLAAVTKLGPRRLHRHQNIFQQRKLQCLGQLKEHRSTHGDDTVYTGTLAWQNCPRDYAVGKKRRLMAASFVLPDSDCSMKVTCVCWPYGQRGETFCSGGLWNEAAKSVVIGNIPNFASNAVVFNEDFGALVKLLQHNETERVKQVFSDFTESFVSQELIDISQSLIGGTNFEKDRGYKASLRSDNSRHDEALLPEFLRPIFHNTSDISDTIESDDANSAGRGNETIATDRLRGNSDPQDRMPTGEVVSMQLQDSFDIDKSPNGEVTAAYRVTFLSEVTVMHGVFALPQECFFEAEKAYETVAEGTLAGSSPLPFSRFYFVQDGCPTSAEWEFMIDHIETSTVDTPIGLSSPTDEAAIINKVVMSVSLSPLKGVLPLNGGQRLRLQCRMSTAHHPIDPENVFRRCETVNHSSGMLSNRDTAFSTQPTHHQSNAAYVLRQLYKRAGDTVSDSSLFSKRPIEKRSCAELDRFPRPQMGKNLLYICGNVFPDYEQASSRTYRDIASQALVAALEQEDIPDRIKDFFNYTTVLERASGRANSIPPQLTKIPESASVSFDDAEESELLQLINRASLRLKELRQNDNGVEPQPQSNVTQLGDIVSENWPPQANTKKAAAVKWTISNRTSFLHVPESSEEDNFGNEDALEEEIIEAEFQQNAKRKARIPAKLKLERKKQTLQTIGGGSERGQNGRRRKSMVYDTDGVPNVTVESNTYSSSQRDAFSSEDDQFLLADVDDAFSEQDFSSDGLVDFEGRPAHGDEINSTSEEASVAESIDTMDAVNGEAYEMTDAATPVISSASTGNYSNNSIVPSDEKDATAPILSSIPSFAARKRSEQTWVDEIADLDLQSLIQVSGIPDRPPGDGRGVLQNGTSGIRTRRPPGSIGRREKNRRGSRRSNDNTSRRFSENFDPALNELVAADSNSTTKRDAHYSFNALRRLAVERSNKPPPVFAFHSWEEDSSTSQRSDQTFARNDEPTALDPGEYLDLLDDDDNGKGDLFSLWDEVSRFEQEVATISSVRVARVDPLEIDNPETQGRNTTIAVSTAADSTVVVGYEREALASFNGNITVRDGLKRPEYNVIQQRAADDIAMDDDQNIKMRSRGNPAVPNRGILGLGIGRHVPISQASINKIVNAYVYGPWLVEWGRDKLDRATAVQIGNDLGFVESAIGAVQREFTFMTGWREFLYRLAYNEVREELSIGAAYRGYAVNVDRSQKLHATAVEVFFRGVQMGVIADFTDRHAGFRISFRNFEIMLTHDFDDYFIQADGGFGSEIFVRWQAISAGLLTDVAEKKLGVTIGIRNINLGILHDFDNFLTLAQANWGRGWQLALESDFPDEASISTFVGAGVGKLNRMFGQIGVGIGDDAVPQASARIQTRNSGVSFDALDLLGQRIFQYAITVGRFTYVWQMNVDLNNVRVPNILGIQPEKVERLLLSALPKRPM